jgi:histidinol-phosphate aminotransferase
MSQFWTDKARDTVPYVPGEQPKQIDLVKLNTNEHALPPSAAVLDALRNVSGDMLRRYPDPDATALKQRIAEDEGLTPSNVFVGNGSDEVIALAWQALFARPCGVTTVDVTYSFYPVWAQLYDTELRIQPLQDDFSVDVEAMNQSQGTLLLANPNAPTGLALSCAEIEYLVQSRPDRLVVVDEAYQGFGAETAAPLIARYDNLLVTRTLSKTWSLAGLRVGYALGHQDLVTAISRIKDAFNSYPIDAVAQSVAVAALQDREWLRHASATVVKARDELIDSMRAMDFDVLPSAANFIFVQHRTRSGEELFGVLRSHGVIVRRWNQPRIENFLRITIGTEEQNQRLLVALSETL